MKFLLEFVSCCGVVGGGDKEVVAQREEKRRSEETRALVRTVSSRAKQRHRSRKRGRAGSVAGVAEWKPTLGAISEDNVLVVQEKKVAERTVKRKGGGGGSRNISSVPSYVEDNRRNHVSTVIPVFSATPFMI